MTAFAEENEKDETFREICESVAARAIASSQSETKTSLIVKLSKKFTTASNAPKTFDWEAGHMIAPEEQLKRLNEFITAMQKEEGDSDDAHDSFSKNMKHVRNYKSDSKPVD
jgi:hypothetical protein